VGLALLTILTNLIFIFIFNLGILGVAIATAFSLTSYNVIKTWFNYKKFGIHPFSFQYLYIVGFVLFCLVISFVLPDFQNVFISLIYKPVVVVFLFFVMNTFFKIIPINELIPKKIKSFFNNDKQ
jgi:Na+-driven multidrug efflux pump